MIDNTPHFDENDYEFNKESNIGILILDAVGNINSSLIP